MTEQGKSRRPKGTGSVYVRDGVVIGQYEVRTPDGEIRRRYVRGKDKKEVAGRLARAIADRDSGLVYDSGKATVGEYLEGWLDAIRGSLRERTWRRHEEIARIHLKPALGKTRLDGLNALQVQSLYRSKLDSGLSPRTVQMVHLTLHKALKQAVKWMLIPRNIAEAVDPPRPASKEIRPLAAGQVKKLLVAARGDKLEGLYVLAVTTGLRQGELLGLKWGDLDLRVGKLRVRRTVFEGVVNPPKTAKSNRSVRLTKEAVRLLAERPREGEWVFPTRVGTPISCHNLINRSWKPLLKRAGLPDSRFHDLRHTCATLLLTKGVHPKIVQEMLGHSSITITLDLYSHVLPDMQQEAVSAMEDLLE
ncbi:MAG: Integrase [uncultured Rubrobacteraceae bacterium]|uniref:Integrase n=1 Tax=uncultured Rubrobacteraceae bacterium TaxID=349277 RepID=A0A6J4QYW4_9ACTN|nr:MAG: Integrase [uncultured Rubrobacteraceae bacterium]